jgi:hypothetical protein
LKKAAIAVAALLLAVSMVLPVVRSVNLSAGKYITIDQTLVADGWPLPPYPPTLVADGWPLPPYPPTLVADGWPLPPYPPTLLKMQAIA